jgi:hypothetical protein
MVYRDLPLLTPFRPLQVIDFTVRLEYARLFWYHPALKRNTKKSKARV